MKFICRRFLADCSSREAESFSAAFSSGSRDIGDRALVKPENEGARILARPESELVALGRELQCPLRVRRKRTLPEGVSLIPVGVCRKRTPPEGASLIPAASA